MAKRDNAPQRRQTARKLTSNQQEWKHQVSNLKRRIKDLERQGAIVDFKIPEMPKIVRKEAIERIKNIRRRDLVRGVEYKPVGEKKEIKYKPAQQINEQGKLEKWKAPERGKAKEREAEVRARKIAEDIADLAREASKIVKPEPIPMPEPQPIDIPEPESEPEPEPNPYDFDDGSWEDWDDEYWDATGFTESDIINEEDMAEAQIENLRGFWSDLGDDAVIEQFNNILDGMINKDGAVAVADRINNNLEQISQYSQLATKYKDTPKGSGFVNHIAQLLAGDRILSFGELSALERDNDSREDYALPL